MQEPLTLSFEAGPNSLQIEITREGDAQSRAHGDARLSATVRSEGFSGRAICWADRDSLDGFSRGMSGLQERGLGQAELRSSSPDELVLSIYPISARGVFAVEGELSTMVHGQEQAFRHAVSFGFEIEAMQIERAATQLSSLTASTSWRVVEMTRRNDN